MAGKKYTGTSISSGMIDLGGGLNSTTSSLALRDNEMSDLQNVDFDVFGSVKQRNGYDTLNSSAINGGAACTGLYDTDIILSGASTTSTYLIGFFEDKMYKMDDLDETWDEITISGTTITAGANLQVDMSQLSNLVIATNGTDKPISWRGGAGNAAVAPVPLNLTKAKYVSTWNNYMFYANTTVNSVPNPSRIYWSDLKDPYTWESTSFIDIRKDDGGEITGIEPLGDRLVIFKSNSIHNVVFTGDSNIPFIVVESKSDVGCASGYSIQRSNNGLIFLANDGFYFYDGSNSLKLSDRINTTISGLSRNRFKYAVSGYLGTKDLYWCSFTESGDTEHSVIITFNTVKDAFSVYSGIAANSIVSLITAGEERIYFGDYDGFVYRADYGTNDNPLGVETAIDAYFKTKWFSFDDIMDKKGLPHITLYYQIKAATIILGYSYDLEDSSQYSQSIYIGTSEDVYGSAVYGEAKYASSGGVVIRRDLTGRGRLVRLSISNSTLDESFQIDAIGFYPHRESVK